MPADWLSDRLSFGSTLRCWMPDDFEAYARILHPSWDRDEGFIRWADIAAWAGTELTPTADFVELSRRRADRKQWSDGHSLPAEGRLDPEQLDALSSILADATSTPDEVWMLSGGGYRGAAGSTPIDELEINPSITASGRRYVGYRGSLVEPVPPGWRSPEHQYASLWWATDRRWFVSTEIDSASTYVGADARTVSRIMAEDMLEAFPAGLDDYLSGSASP